MQVEANQTIHFAALPIRVCTVQHTAVLLHSRTCTCVLVYLDIHGRPCSNLVPSPHQSTPLHYAAEEGHLDAMQHLVGAGGDINIKDDYGVSE